MEHHLNQIIQPKFNVPWRRVVIVELGSSISKTDYKTPTTKTCSEFLFDNIEYLVDINIFNDLKIGGVCSR